MAGIPTCPGFLADGNGGARTQGVRERDTVLYVFTMSMTIIDIHDLKKGTVFGKQAKEQGKRARQKDAVRGVRLHSQNPAKRSKCAVIRNWGWRTNGLQKVHVGIAVATHSWAGSVHRRQEAGTVEHVGCELSFDRQEVPGSSVGT